MKTIELAQVQRDFPGICQSIAQTWQAIIVTQECEPLVSIGPPPRVVSGREGTVWERRRQFEEGHGPLTEDLIVEDWSIAR